MREKAKQLVTLLKDEERLRVERVHALKTKEKMAQTSSGETSVPRVCPTCLSGASYCHCVCVCACWFLSLLSPFSAQPRGQPVSGLPFWGGGPRPGLATEFWRGRSAAPAGFGHEQRGSRAGNGDQLNHRGLGII